MNLAGKFNKFLVKCCIGIFSFVMIINLESCHASKKRIMVLNCAHTSVSPDSREGYFNARARYHFFSRHSPAKATRR